MEKEIADIAETYKTNISLEMTGEDKRNLKPAHCHICGNALGNDRVRDHDHLTGKYRGAAHNECNLNFKVPKFVPIVFHNLSGYDAHLFIKELGFGEGKINCIPNTDEKYISFSKKVGEIEMRFIDSNRFLLAPIDELAKNLPRDKIKATQQRFGDKTDLMLRKGVYPYEYMDCAEKLNDTKLPAKKHFYSKLTNKDISDKDYKHAKQVWKAFGCQTMKDYHNLYLESDVALLEDIFENFRDNCMRTHKVDLAHYYTVPGLSYDAMLKFTKVKLQLLTDPDMLLMFEKANRGGVSMISHRLGEASNRYMENYNPLQPTKFLTYLDANNLYGWAMAEALPTGGFEWVDPEEIDEILAYSNYGENGGVGRLRL